MRHVTVARSKGACIMARYFKKDIDFLGKKKIFFIISSLLCIVSIVAILFQGLNLGIEFVGGTSITFSDAGTVSLDDMRSACTQAGFADATIQTTEANGTSGFLIRTNTIDPNESAANAASIAQTLGLSTSSYEVSVIGPDWGTTVLRSSLIAFIVAIGAIIIYIAIRFEWKMGFVAILALIHDLLIVIGIYALFKLEVTPNVVAALLTIMGYSLYDTVVVFHRMNENASTSMKCSFMSMANHSINQVFTRTINTSLASLIPVIAMLIFGGETLKGFALAMIIGLVAGSYSSIGVASPLYALWKDREPAFAKLKTRYGYERHVTDSVVQGLYSMADLNGDSERCENSSDDVAVSAQNFQQEELSAYEERQSAKSVHQSAHRGKQSRAQRKKHHG